MRGATPRPVLLVFINKKMREIKFRAWEYNIMVYGVCVIDPERDYELMQYTGLKDKNGKEIYEGDIIEYWQSYPVKKDEELIRVVMVWEEDVDYDGLFMMSGWRLDSDSNDAEIIGNIYENKELLD
jgi:uncharacterized phage protein (TIGR01671 family)